MLVGVRAAVVRRRDPSSVSAPGDQCRVARRSRIASTHGDHNIYVTEVSSGALLNTLRGHPRSPWCVAFHPTNSQLIASGCLGGQVRVWDLHVSYTVGPARDLHWDLHVSQAGGR